MPGTKNYGTKNSSYYGYAILIGAGATSTKVYLNQLNVSALLLPAGVWLFLSAMGVLAARRKLST